LITALVDELRQVADEDARLLAEGKPLPTGIPEAQGPSRLPVNAR
jgi:hypothetical protein